MSERWHAPTPLGQKTAFGTLLNLILHMLSFDCSFLSFKYSFVKKKKTHKQNNSNKNTHRPIAQNRESLNKPKHLWSTNSKRPPRRHNKESLLNKWFWEN
jgi:hypothetical protein